jgi:hypothetical protein
MPQVASRALALRVGWFGPDPATEPAAAGGGFAELPLAGDDNPCDLDVLLALAEEGRDAGGAREALENLRDALGRESPPDPRHADETLPESLAAAHVWAREPRPGVRPRVSLSCICARGGRYFVAQAPGMPVYLLRADGLRPLAGDLPRLRGGGDDLEPEIVSGVLEDGDALLVCSQSVHEALSDRQLREILVHATGPETAVRRLVTEARKEGARHPQAAVLFAGVGPAVAFRLRAPIAAASENRHHAEAGSSGRRKSGRTSMVALLGALAGALIGVSIGVVVTLSVAGPHPAPGGEAQSIAPGTAITPLSIPSQAAEAAIPTPPAPKPANTPGSAPAANGPAGNAPLAATGNAPSLAVNGPTAVAGNGPAGNAPAPAVFQGPSNGVRTAALPAEPPRHTLAAGLAGGGRLILKVDSAGSRFTAETTQGILYSPPSSQGAPVGEPLSAPLAELLRDQPEHGELRLVNGDETVASVSGTALEKFLHGESTTLGPLHAGEYRLCWWNSDTSALSGPVTTLRLAGF